MLGNKPHLQGEAKPGENEDSTKLDTHEGISTLALGWWSTRPFQGSAQHQDVRNGLRTAPCSRAASVELGILLPNYICNSGLVHLFFINIYIDICGL